MGGKGLQKFIAGVIFLGGLALMVVSVVQRDAGQLWMPWMHVVSWAVIMVGVAAFTYEPEEAIQARTQYGEANPDEMGFKNAA
jgi:preprotein translocase subunit SecY